MSRFSPNDGGRAELSYTLEWLHNRGLAKIRHFGDVTTAEIQDSLNDVEQEKGAAERPCLLVDVRDTTSYPKLADLLLLAEQNCRRPRVSEKTAFVFNQQTAEVIEFVVLAASNRGFLVEGFMEESTAVGWLVESQTS